MKKYQTIITYLLSSGLSFVVDLGIFTLVNHLIDNILISSYIARVFSSTFNFLANKYFVFKNRKKKDYKAMIEYFILVLINITISGTLVTKIYKLIHFNVTVIKALIDTIIFVINYILQKLVIFKN